MLRVAPAPVRPARRRPGQRTACSCPPRSDPRLAGLRLAGLRLAGLRPSLAGLSRRSGRRRRPVPARLAFRSPPGGAAKHRPQTAQTGAPRVSRAVWHFRKIPAPNAATFCRRRQPGHPPARCAGVPRPVPDWPVRPAGGPPIFRPGQAANGWMTPAAIWRFATTGSARAPPAPGWQRRAAGRLLRVRARPSHARHRTRRSQIQSRAADRQRAERRSG